jgi:hypothetical protein
MLGLKQILPGLFGTKKKSYSEIGLGNKTVNQTLSEASYKKTKDRPLEVKSQGLDLIYQAQYSNERIAVYIDHKKKEIKIGFRGTVPTSLRDLISDVKIATGIGRDSDPYIIEAQALVKKLKSLYPDYKISTTGHSLGGFISREIAKKENVEGLGFNPGAGLPELFGKKDPKIFGTIRNEGDLVSALAQPSNANANYFAGTFGQVHTLDKI